MTYRSFISIILAAAIAITGMTAAPAQARDRDDVAKWIAGAAALAIIGAAIAENRRDDRSVSRYRSYDNNYYNQKQYNRGYQQKHYRHGHKQKHYQGKQRFNRHALPNQCQRVVQTRRGDVYGYGRRCLLNNYAHFNSLPHQCAVKTRGYNGQRRVIYSQYCLQQNGFGYGVANSGRR